LKATAELRERLQGGQNPMISADKAKEILKSNGIHLATMAADPQVFQSACRRVYKTIPIPWRWFIGKQRIEKILSKLAEQVGKKVGPQEAMRGGPPSSRL
jgi:hypothetical protein